MSTHQLLTTAPVVQSRLPWMRGGEDVISARVVGGNVDSAAHAIEEVASKRGLKIVEVARFTKDDVDAVFARGTK